MTKVYVGDVGTVLLLETGQSLAGASALTIEARKPTGTTVSWTATASGTQVRYVSVSGTFDTPGIWQVQAGVVLPSGTWRGETAQFQVYRAFE